MPEKEKPKFRLLTLPKNEDFIMNRIESLQRAIDESGDFAYYDELLTSILASIYNLPDEIHEINRFIDKVSEARFWLNEYLDGIEYEKKEAIKPTQTPVK